MYDQPKQATGLGLSQEYETSRRAPGLVYPMSAANKDTRAAAEERIVATWTLKGTSNRR